MEHTGRLVDIDFVDDGQQLLDYLRHQGAYAELGQGRPCRLVLLDLNMPVRDGRAALLELKRDPALRHLPVVVLTSLRNMDDVREVYALGANSFVVKPASFASFVSMVDSLVSYWFDLSLLPAKSDR